MSTMHRRHVNRWIELLIARSHESRAHPNFDRDVKDVQRTTLPRCELPFRRRRSAIQCGATLLFAVNMQAEPSVVTAVDADDIKSANVGGLPESSHPEDSINRSRMHHTPSHLSRWRYLLRFLSSTRCQSTVL